MEQGQGGLGGTRQQSGGVPNETEADMRYAAGEPKIRSRVVGASMAYVVDAAKW